MWSHLCLFCSLNSPIPSLNFCLSTYFLFRVVTIACLTIICIWFSDCLQVDRELKNIFFRHMNKDRVKITGILIVSLKRVSHLSEFRFYLQIDNFHEQAQNIILISCILASNVIWSRQQNRQGYFWCVRSASWFGCSRWLVWQCI